MRYIFYIRTPFKSRNIKTSSAFQIPKPKFFISSKFTLKKSRRSVDILTHNAMRWPFLYKKNAPTNMTVAYFKRIQIARVAFCAVDIKTQAPAKLSTEVQMLIYGNMYYFQVFAYRATSLFGGPAFDVEFFVFACIAV